MSESVKLTRNDGILEILIDRPKANAIDLATSRRLNEVITEFRNDAALRVAIISGAGEKFFSAGWDLKAAAGGEASDADWGVGGFALSRLQAMLFAASKDAADALAVAICHAQHRGARLLERRLAAGT